jgi:hypothetical protein
VISVLHGLVEAEVCAAAVPVFAAAAVRGGVFAVPFDAVFAVPFKVRSHMPLRVMTGVSGETFDSGCAGADFAALSELAGGAACEVEELVAGDEPGLAAFVAACAMAMLALVREIRLSRRNLR